MPPVKSFRFESHDYRKVLSDSFKLRFDVQEYFLRFLVLFDYGHLHQFGSGHVPFSDVLHHLITVDRVQATCPPRSSNLAVLDRHAPNLFEILYVINSLLVLFEHSGCHLKLSLSQMELLYFLLDSLKILFDDLKLIVFGHNVR